MKNCKELIQPQDLVICDGDFMIGERRKCRDIMAELPGRWVLVLGNHDDSAHGPDWWMSNGFVFACHALIYRKIWFTHQPSPFLPPGCEINIHGHLHSFERSVHPDYKAQPFQRLFAVEYTNYKPVQLQKFVAHPDKYNARIHLGCTHIYSCGCKEVEVGAEKLSDERHGHPCPRHGGHK